MFKKCKTGQNQDHVRCENRAENADFKNISSFVYSQEIEIEWNVVVSINFSID